MTRCDTVLLADRVITPTGEGPAAVAVAGGRIVAVTELRDAPPAVRTVQLADDEVLMPGLVDTHVHLQESGRPGWEGVESGTRAAALGGTTTVVDMPLDGLPVTVDLASLEAKQRALRGRCGIDVGLWGGAVPGMAGMVELQLAGVLGFKAFLAPSGCQEFLPLSPVELTAALRKLVPTGLPLLVHAEDETHALPLRSPAPSYATYLASRPATVETAAVAVVIDAVRSVGGRAHVVHVSSAGAVELLRAARREGLRVTAETCPHYLVRPAETIGDGDTRVKALPAVRGAAEADVLWQALADGVLDLVVSDHSPCAPGTKSTGDFVLAPPVCRHSSSDCPSCGARHGAEDTACWTWPAGWRRRPLTWQGSPARAGSRWAPTPTWSSWPPTTRSSSSPRTSRTASAVRRTTAGN